MSTRHRHYLQAHLCGNCRAAHGWCPTCSEPWGIDLSDRMGGPWPDRWTLGCTLCQSMLYIEVVGPAPLPPGADRPAQWSPLSDRLPALERALRSDNAHLATADAGQLLRRAQAAWRPPVIPGMGVSAPVAPPPPPRPKKRQSHQMQPHHLERLRQRVAAQAVSPYAPCPPGIERRTLREWVAAGEPITAAPAAVAAAYKRRFGRPPRKQGQMATYSRRELQIAAAKVH